MCDPNNYTDLEIRILEKQERGYPVEIVFNGDQEFPRGFLDPAAQPQIDRAFPQVTGERLFQWLFAANELQAAWAQARGCHPRRRIRFRIDATAPELHTIAWELLRDPGAGSTPQDLAATEATPFSRYLAGQWIPGGPILKRPVRILVAIANPANLEDFGLTAIDSDLEWDLLQKAVAGNRNVELSRLPDPCTLPAIEAALRKGVHILHFVGHGQFLQNKGQAVLYLADENNSVAPATDAAVGGMLARQLMDAGIATDDKLRLVHLSSCQTAVRSPADAFRGLGPQLVASGVPAVLAMQDVVPVAAAHAFSETFYRDLLEHGEVDRASNAARSSLLTAGIRGAGIPVLFMRLRSGQLLGNRGMILGARAESFWSTLLENLADQECTPFLGPGVTMDLLPRPEELSGELARKFKYPFPDHANLTRVTQFIGTIDNRRLRKQVLTVLIEQFRKRMGLPADAARSSQSLSQAIEQSGWPGLGRQLFESEIHRQLADLSLPLYLTTNFDNFMALSLKDKAGKVRRETVPWRKPATDRPNLAMPLSSEDPVVLHLFGTDEDLLSMVLTEDDHLDYLARISHDHEYFLPVSVNERLASTTLLFLGYRLEDLDLKVIMRGLLTHLDLERWGMLHVAVQLESAERDKATEKEVIDYFEKYFSESRIDIYWGSAQQFMADLSARWQEFRRA